MSDKSATVVGAGAIGIGWAIVFSEAGWSVAIYDVDEGQRNSFKSKVATRLELLKRHGLLESTVDEVLGKINVCQRIEEACINTSFIQECGPENLQVKQSLFYDFETMVSSDVILASSSSALKPSLISEKMRNPERFLVVHPANPPYLLPVVEVVPSDKTSKSAIDQTISMLKDLNMNPILVKGEPEGFVFNRLQGAVLREAYCLVRDGVISPLDLDTIMTKGLGRRWSLIGPFATTALNVKGGIRAHTKRMGESYLRMGKERGQNDPWTPELVEKVADEMESKWHDADWDENTLKRDVALMKLLSYFKKDSDINL